MENTVMYHGSFKSFKEFDLNKIGSGNGRMRNGWGLYCSSFIKEAFNYSTNYYENFTFDEKTFFYFNFELENLEKFISGLIYGFERTWRKQPKTRLDFSEYFKQIHKLDVMFNYNMYGYQPLEVRNGVLEELKNIKRILENIDLWFDNNEHLNYVSIIKNSQIYNICLQKINYHIAEVTKYKKLYLWRSDTFGWVYKLNVKIKSSEIIDYNSFSNKQIEIIGKRFNRDYPKLKFENVSNLNDLEKLLSLPNYTFVEDCKRTSLFLYRCGFKAIEGVGLCIIDRKAYSIVDKFCSKFLYLNGIQ